MALARFRRKAASEREQERKSLLDGMLETRQSLNDAYAGFNNTRDPDLIEFYVYQMNALQSRYSYLLRRVRELEEVSAAGR